MLNVPVPAFAVTVPLTVWVPPGMLRVTSPYSVPAGAEFNVIARCSAGVPAVSYPPSQSDRLLAQVMYWVRNLVIAGIAIHAYRRLRAPTHDRFKTRSTSRTMADANAV